MPIEIDSDSLEGKIIRLLMEGRPMTINEVADELKISKSRVERKVKALVSKDIIQVEELPDKKYLRLLRRDIKFHGVNPSQEKAIKKKKKEKEEENKGSEKSRRMMYR